MLSHGAPSAAFSQPHQPPILSFFQLSPRLSFEKKTRIGFVDLSIFSITSPDHSSNHSSAAARRQQWHRHLYPCLLHHHHRHHHLLLFHFHPLPSGFEFCEPSRLPV